MFRGYRHIVLAIGLVLYASLAYSQDQPDAALADSDERGERGSVQNQTEAKQEPPQPSAVPTIGADRTLPEPDPENYQTPCGAPKTDDDADLCQQWRMAEAAEETADWAFGQIIATGFEAVLLAIAIGVAFWAGSWAKSAAIAGQKMVREASKATSAAQKAVEVTRDIGQRQIRAYVGVTKARVSYDEEAKTISYHLEISNTGQTPAYHTAIVTQHAYVGRNAKRMAKFRDELKHGSRTSISSGFPVHINRTIKLPNEPDIIRFCLEEEGGFYVYGYLRYIDAFHRQRRTIFNYRINVAEMVKGEERVFDVAPRGNRSS